MELTADIKNHNNEAAMESEININQEPTNIDDFHNIKENIILQCDGGECFRENMELIADIKNHNTEAAMESKINIKCNFSCGAQESKSPTRSDLINDDIKPYDSETNDKECDNMNAIAFNIKSPVHIHDGCTLYRCIKCGKNFKDEIYLKFHEGIHAEFKKHKCNICSCLFVTRNRLRVHLTTHTPYENTIEYICEACGLTFKTWRILKQHKKNTCVKKRNVYKFRFTKNDTLNTQEEYRKIRRRLDGKPYLRLYRLWRKIRVQRQTRNSSKNSHQPDAL